MSSNQIKKDIIDSNNLISNSSPAFQFCQKVTEINNQNEKGETPIYLSILSNNILSLKDLLLLGANPNIPNNSGDTPLFLSIYKNDFNSFLFLLKYKTDCNIQNKKGESPLHIAVQIKEKKFIKALLMNNANPNSKNLLGQTPTHLAIINMLDEETLKLFKENKGDIFFVKDKYNKTALDYAKEFKDEKYIRILLKIFGYRKNTCIYLNNQNNNSQSEDIEEIENSANQFMNNTDKNKNTINLDDFQLREIADFSTINNNGDYYRITIDTNKNEFKLENSDSNKEGQGSNQSLIKNKILSSDVSSENVQIKELNNSSENNSNNSRKIFNEFLNEEKLNNINNINNNISRQITIKSDKSDNISNNITSRNDKNKKNNGIINFSTSSNNFTHNSHIRGSNSSSNLYLTNSVGVNKKIIKSIIHDTVKKITVKSISSSEDNSNINIYSKDSEHIFHNKSNMEDKKLKIKQNFNENKENNNLNNHNNDSDSGVVNLYENGTNSFILLRGKNITDLINNNNIDVSKLIENETKTINISHIYEDLYVNTNKTSEINTIKIEDENKTINIKDINSTENNNSNIDNLNNKEISNLNNEIKDNIFLETTNSNIFSELQIKTNNNSPLNNDISLNYSKNLQTDEDNQLKYTENKNNIEKDNNKIKTKDKSSSNCEFKIVEGNDINENNNFYVQIDTNENKNLHKNNIIDNSVKENLSIINNNTTDNIRKSHLKKKSNGNLDSNIGLKEINSFIDENKANNNNHKIKNNKNSSLDNHLHISKNNKDNKGNTLFKRKILNKNNINYRKQIYLKNHRQLSYHLNNKPYLNNNDIQINLNENLEDISSNNLSNINVINNIKGNYNPNFETLKSDRIYKNKNNLNHACYINASNKNFKNSIKNKNSNNFSGINRNSKVSLSKSGSCQNMNPPPIELIENKDNLFYPSFKSRNTINNKINIVSHTIIDTKKNKFSNANTLLTTLSTKKPKHCSLDKINSNNLFQNLKNIPMTSSNNNTKYIYQNPYINSNVFNENYNDFESDESNNNINNKIKILKKISTNTLVRLREWLISCDLLCYYNLLLSKNTYHIDSYINDLQEGIVPLTYEDIEKIGIKKPGHIFRFLIKLDIDAGLINNNLFNYIIEKINYISVNTTLALTSSLNDVFCCGINLCPKNINRKNTNKRRLRNNAIYFNDLSSFLRINDLIRFKANFIHNGFDKIEFVIIQLFSKYSFNKKILNEYLHIYIERDKIKLLKILYMMKFNIAKEFGINANEEELEKIINSTNKTNIYDSEYDLNSALDSKLIDNKNESNINISNRNLEINDSNNFCHIF